MDLAVVPEREDVGVQVPVLRVVEDIVSEGRNQGLVESFCLSIRSGMVSCREDVVNPQRSTDVAEESGGELRAVVGEDVLRWSIAEDPCVDKRSCYLIGCTSFEWHSSYEFGVPIGNHEEVVVSSWGLE